MPVGRTIAIVVLLLCILLVAQGTLPDQVIEATRAAGEISPVEDASQTEATTAKARVGLILGNLLILALYGFPMSIGEGWALADPMKAEKQRKTESSEVLEALETPDKPALTIGSEAPDSVDDWTALLERLPHWVRSPRGVPAGVVAGVCLTAVVALLGANAFAVYYHFSGQPEKISQILPRFAYWLPFGLLGLITDVPFQVFDWEDRRLRVLLRLILWWFPRLVIFAFVFNPPILQGLDPATTALAMLAIDGVLAAFFLWLHASREKIPSVLR